MSLDMVDRRRSLPEGVRGRTPPPRFLFLLVSLKKDLLYLGPSPPGGGGVIG